MKFEIDTEGLIQKELDEMLKIMMVNVQYNDKDDFTCGCYISSRSQWIEAPDIPVDTNSREPDTEWDLSVEVNGFKWYKVDTTSWEWKFIENKEKLDANSRTEGVHVDTSLDIAKRLTDIELDYLKKFVNLKLTHSFVFQFPVMAHYYVMVNDEIWIPQRPFETLLKDDTHEYSNTVRTFEGMSYIQTHSQCNILDSWLIRDLNHCMIQARPRTIRAVRTDTQQKVDVKFHESTLHSVTYCDMETDELYAWAWMWMDMITTHDPDATQAIPTSMQMKEHWKCRTLTGHDPLTKFLQQKMDTTSRKAINDKCIWIWKRLLIKCIFMNAIASTFKKDKNQYVDLECRDASIRTYKQVDPLQDTDMGYAKPNKLYIEARTQPWKLLKRVDENK